MFGIGKSPSKDEEKKDDKKDSKDEKESKEQKLEEEDSEEEKKKKATVDAKPLYKPQKGDYIVRVHIIEARELKGRGLGDMSDPVVKVSCLNQDKVTSIKIKNLNPFWDVILTFQVKDLEPNGLDIEKIRINVMDACTIKRDVMIGSYEFDLAKVYFNPDHEIYKSWIALGDLTNPDNEGVQGYLKLSVVCLGPGDEQKIHNEDEEDDDDMTVLTPPHIERKGWLLNVQVYEAKELMQMDDSVFDAKCDPFVSVEYGSLTLETDRQKGLNVEFNQEVQLPVFEPTMSDTIKVSLWDYDFGVKNELMGCSTVFKFGKAKDGYLPRWVNFYGPSQVISLTRDILVAEKMSKGIVEGTHFTGRVLLGMSATPTEVPRKAVASCAKLMDENRPKDVVWAIQCDLYCAMEVAQSGKWCVEICCGDNSFQSVDVENNNGVLKWYSALLGKKDSSELLFKSPEDPTQVPDVFVYLRRKKYRISYCRFRFASLLDGGWNTPPKWFLMKEDKALNKLGDDEFPGLLYMGLRAGLASSVPPEVSRIARPVIRAGIEQKVEEKKQDLKVASPQPQSPAQSPVRSPEPVSRVGDMKITVIQAKGLPAADRNGFSDPYVVLQLGKVKHKTAVVKKNLNPVWRQTFEFKQASIDDIVNVEVFDEDNVVDETLGKFDISIGELAASQPGKNFLISRQYSLSTSGKVELEVEFKFLAADQVKKKPELVEQKSFFGDVSQAFGNLKDVVVGKDVDIKKLAGYFGEPQYNQYQIRAHIYQARMLPSSDPNGLADPYVSVRCASVISQTLVCEETLNPIWYSTKVLNVSLPNPLSMASDIYCYVYDKDFLLKDDLLGMFCVKIDDLLDFVDELTPKWYSLTDVDGNPVEGQVLACFQLLPIEKRNISIPSLKPPTVPMYLEIVSLGLRSLQSTLGINKPRIEFELPNGKRFMTDSSCVPDSHNPNFLQVLKLPLQVPENRIFAPALNVEVRDLLFGGWVKRRIGVSCLLLENYMKDDDAGEWKGDSKFKILDESEIEREILAIENKRKSEVQPILFEETPKLVEVEEKKDEPDVAVPIDTPDEKGPEIIDPDDKAPLLIDVKKETVGDAIICDFLEKIEKSEDDIPDYLKGRETVDDELEDQLSMKPFDSIEIFTGSKSAGLFGPKFRKVGIFKGLIRLLKDPNTPPAVDHQLLLAPKSVFVRVYVLRARGLSPMDFDGSSDPYIVASLGKQKFDTRSQYVKKSLNPDFYQGFEFPCQIPGASEVKIDVFDFDGIGDDLIGSTVIDIEDRWFTKDWRIIKKKPIEWRTLHNPTSSAGQGKLELWVDIMDTNQAKTEPLINISPPPLENWELRLIIWECKEVSIKDLITNQNDLYVTGRIDIPGLRSQRTDTHLRSKKGKGSWNWRFKFPLQIPLKQPRISLQIWDMDFFSANDSICEAYLSMKNLFKKAYKVKDRVKWVKDGDEKFWLEDLTHPNEPGKPQGKLRVSFELLPVTVAEQLPAGLGRADPNMNPVLGEPEGRMVWDFMNPWNILKDLLGEDLYRKMCLGIFCVLLIVALVFLAPSLFGSIIARVLVG